MMATLRLIFMKNDCYRLSENITITVNHASYATLMYINKN